MRSREIGRQQSLLSFATALIIFLTVFSAVPNGFVRNSYALSDNITIQTSADTSGGTFFGHGALQVIIEDYETDDNIDEVQVGEKLKLIYQDLMDDSDHTSTTEITIIDSQYNPQQQPVIDFNGDGYEDLAIGVPTEDIGIAMGAGAINVIYGSSIGLSATKANPDQLIHQNSLGIEDSAESFDGFGHALAAGDFNADGYTDLAIGVPEEDVGTIIDAGAVNIIYGSFDGLSTSAATIPDQLWWQAIDGIDVDAIQFGYFGRSMTTGDYNEDGFDDLAIGAVTSVISALDSNSLSANGDREGMVTIIFGSESGLQPSVSDQNTEEDDEQYDTSTLKPQTLTTSDLNAELETGDDSFGETLATGDFNADDFDDLVIGTPEADFNDALAKTYTKEAAGAADIIFGSSSGLSAEYSTASQHLDQESLGFRSAAIDKFGSSLETADFNGDGYSDLAVGIVNKDISGMILGGAVVAIYGSPAGAVTGDANRATSLPMEPRMWHQNYPAIEGQVEAEDQFGTSLSAADFNHDGYADLAIGTPLENIESIEDAGAVNIIYGSSSGLQANVASDGTGRKDQLWHQNFPGIQGTAEVGDRFGSSISTGDFNNDGYSDLAIGVPGEDLDSNATPNAGMVNVIYGSFSGLSTSRSVADQAWHQDTPSVEGELEGEDEFGQSLSNN